MIFRNTRKCISSGTSCDREHALETDRPDSTRLTPVPQCTPLWHLPTVTATQPSAKVDVDLTLEQQALLRQMYTLKRAQPPPWFGLIPFTAFIDHRPQSQLLCWSSLFILSTDFFSPLFFKLDVVRCHIFFPFPASFLFSFMRVPALSLTLQRSWSPFCLTGPCSSIFGFSTPCD